jgi:hypothetical protein
MKKEEVPQDESNLASANIREVYYALDENGNYTTALSTGWEAKKIALDESIAALEEWIEEARNKVKAGEASPILYFMELNKMDVQVLAGYTGLWTWRVKRHLKPKGFAGLSTKNLQKYAEAFGITLEELTQFKP